jgi:hypothetical protein
MRWNVAGYGRCSQACRWGAVYHLNAESGRIRYQIQCCEELGSTHIVHGTSILGKDTHPF